LGVLSRPYKCESGVTRRLKAARERIYKGGRGRTGGRTRFECIKSLVAH